MLKQVTGPVENNVMKFRNYYQRNVGPSEIVLVDGITKQPTGFVVTLDSWLGNTQRGSVITSGAADTQQYQVEVNFANDVSEHVFDGTDWGRLQGMDVNHDSIAWYVYEKALADLAR